MMERLADILSAVAIAAALFTLFMWEFNLF